MQLEPGDKLFVYTDGIPEAIDKDEVQFGTDRMLEALNDAQNTVDNVNALVNGVQKGQGTLGQLMQNDSLYKSLSKTIESLDNLVNDVKDNPSRYLRSLFVKEKRNNKKEEKNK